MATDFLAQHREAILEIASKYGASNIRVFGSFAAGLERDDSDIDLLVEMPPNSSLLDVVALTDELKKALGRSVDVVTDQALNWVIRRRVLKEAVPI